MDYATAELANMVRKNLPTFFPSAIAANDGASVRAALYAAGLPTLDAGVGSPEGVVSANPGSAYTDYTDPTMPLNYKKATGTGNTGWI